MSSNAKKTTASSSASAKSSQSDNIPLFFYKPAVISLERHTEARLRGDITMAFARDTNSVPLTIADIPEAAKYYPIVFTQDPVPLPVAIVGLEQRNYFVDEEGKWLRGCYVPAYVRKYPFVFMETADSDQLTLCIDEVALTINPAGSGTKIYEDGKPSAFVNNALEFCAAHQEQHVMTRAAGEALLKKNMLSVQRSDVALANGRSIQLGGFQIIEAEQLKNLSEAEVFDWHKRGYLAMIHYVLQSHSNWRNILELANTHEAKAEKVSGAKK